MTLSGSNIIEKLKSSFIETIKDSIYLLNVSNDEKEKYILSKYQIVNTLNFDKQLLNNVKQLAVLENYPIDYEKYSQEDKNKHNEKIYSMSTKIKSEDVFTGHNILELAHQFYYEQHLLDSSNELYYKIVHNFGCHIGNVNYYSVDKNAMKNFFEIGFDLYLITNTMCPDITEAMDKTISAIKYFNLEHNKDYDIRNGSISLTKNAENKIHNQLEELISKVGGRTILKLLFENEFQPKYNKQFERYMITKNKQLSLKSPQTPIPYNYIMKMCLKHLDKDFVPFLTPAIEHDYIKLIKDSMNFIDVLGIYSSNPMSETQMDSLGLIDFIADNTIFENLCIPNQYSKTFLNLILSKIYFPAYINNEKCPNLYKTSSFLKLISAVYSEKPCSILNIKNLAKQVRVKISTIREFLDCFSIDLKDSNAGFKNMFNSTTSSHKPLIKLNSQDYFFLSTQFSGYAFCNNIQDQLQSRQFSRDLGLNLEVFVKDILSKNNYSYKFGHYSPKDQENEGECDLILEDESRILFIELKNCGLPYEFENTDIVTILSCLGEGMLKAQKQILHHKLHLIKNNQKIMLYKDVNDEAPFSVLDNSNNKRIYSISICSSEYAFFTSGTIAKRLTKNMPNVTFHAYDKNRENELRNLNKLSGQIRTLVEDYSQYKKDLSSDDLFFCTTFKTLQQFYYAIKLSNNISELIDYLVFDISIIFPFFDYYANLLSKINLEKSV